jgi:amino acid adenylation domain-containing protein
MRARLLQDWVTASADRCPESRALVDESEVMTYGALESFGNRLARALRECGCRSGDRVAVLMSKSPLAVATLTGVLKAGCCYVPVDPVGATARCADMLRRCEPRVVIARGGDRAWGSVDHLLRSAALPDVHVGWLERDNAPAPAAFALQDLETFSGEPLGAKGAEQDTAYILFTSGSTGSPKGVPISHANVRVFIDWVVKSFELGPHDRLSGHTELTFDLSTFDIYATFAAGAELHHVPRSRQLIPGDLVSFIEERALTLWFSVPSQLSYVARFDGLAQRALPALRHVAWCGDVLPTPSLVYWKRHLPRATFTNLYGPTETTVASSFFRVSEDFDDETAEIPIGVGCDGEELLVLDPELRPVPVGEVGEIYIRGLGVSRGYWRDAGRTAAAFVRDSMSSDPTALMYRTGDLGRTGADGNVYFLGRADFQIKTSGYRVEPAEVESAILRVDGIQACVVVPVPVDDFVGSAVGCAYVPVNGRNAEDLHPRSIKRRLGDALPPYMIPSMWRMLEELPIDSRGKVDRSRIQTLLTE